jgi:hypothetical protein
VQGRFCGSQPHQQAVSSSRQCCWAGISKVLGRLLCRREHWGFAGATPRRPPRTHTANQLPRLGAGALRAQVQKPSHMPAGQPAGQPGTLANAVRPATAAVAAPCDVCEDTATTHMMEWKAIASSARPRLKACVRSSCCPAVLASSARPPHSISLQLACLTQASCARGEGMLVTLLAEQGSLVY